MKEEIPQGGCAISTHNNGVLTRLLAAPKLYRSVLFRVMTKDDPFLDTRLNQPAVVDLGHVQCAIQGAADWPAVYSRPKVLITRCYVGFVL
jgi:hypothetical protein